MKRNELLKLRYHYLRDRGYTSKEANKLKHSTKKLPIDIKVIKEYNTKKQRAKELKKRYHYLKLQGYTSQEANKLKHRTKSVKIDVKRIKLIKKGKKYEVKIIKLTDIIRIIPENDQETLDDEDVLGSDYTIYDRLVDRLGAVKNNSVYSAWGNLTQNKPYADIVASYANKMSKELDISESTAYYYIYFMLSNDVSFSELLDIAKIDPSFEKYVRQRAGY